MSIADELNHYAGGLGDAYDAVNDMNGVIPAQKNLDNLDTAIRTIPQPTVNDGTLTIQKNGTDVATFTANQASNATANISVPTDTSDLTNTAGFITSADLPTNHVTTDTDQDITGAKNFKNVVKVQNGQGTGSMWIGGNVNSNTVSNNSRHLARISVPSYNNIDLGATLLGFDSSGDADMNVSGKTYDVVSFGGMKKITNATSPMAIGFCVTDTRYATAAANKIYALELDADEARFNVQPNFAGVNLATVNDIPGDMTGASSGTAGAHGLVPAPAAGDEGKFLSGAGTWMTVTSGGSYSAGNGINIDSNNAISIDTSVVAEVSDIPTNTSDLTNDGSDGTSTYVEADDLATVATSGLYSDLTGTPTIPTVNNATLTVTQNGTSAGTFTANASSDVTIALTDTTYSAMTGATSGAAGTSGLVPAPAAGDQDKVLKGDGTWGEMSEKFVIMKYGEANAWAKFIDAYNNNKIVYCRASSNANPATGAQTRLAFMAYVSAEVNPTNVEFQYVRSVGTKTSSQPVDQVFVYKLESTNGGTWSVQTRDMAPKLTAGTNASVSYSSGTYTVSATDTTYSAFTGATSGAAGTSGLVPAPAAGDDDTFLKGDGTWATPTDTTYTAGTNVQISAGNVISATDTTYSDFTGTDGLVAGTAGLVPAPATTDVDKFLKSDGTWDTVSNGAEGTTLYITDTKNSDVPGYSSTRFPQNFRIFKDNAYTDEVEIGDVMEALRDGAVNVVIDEVNSPNLAYPGVIVSSYDSAGSAYFYMYAQYSLSQMDAKIFRCVTLMNIPGSTTSFMWQSTSQNAMPNIPTVYNGTLTIQHNGTNVQTFTANSSTNKTANIETIYADTIAPVSTVGSITTNNLADAAVTSAKIDWSTVADVNYSLTEQATGGTWVDGKPIYKKTIDFGALPNATTKNKAHNISNLSQVVRIDAIMNRPGYGFYPLPFVSKSAANDQIELIINSTNVSMAANINWSSSTAYVTLWYTKSS